MDGQNAGGGFKGEGCAENKQEGDREAESGQVLTPQSRLEVPTATPVHGAWEGCLNLSKCVSY